MLQGAEQAPSMVLEGVNTILVRNTAGLDSEKMKAVSSHGFLNSNLSKHFLYWLNYCFITSQMILFSFRNYSEERKEKGINAINANVDWREDKLESNLFILVRGIHNSKSLVISYLHEVEINTIYKNLVQLNPSEINVITMCDKKSLERW